MSLRTGGLRMAKTQGSIIELIDKNLRAWRSHFSSREKVSFIYAKIVKGKEQTAKVMVMIARRMRWSISSATDTLSPLLRLPGPARLLPKEGPQRLFLPRRCMRMRLRMTLKLQASTAMMRSSSRVA